MEDFNGPESEFRSTPEGFYYEVDGLCCEKCYQKVDDWHTDIENHWCIACYYCGEIDSCNCDEINNFYCLLCLEPELDCRCKKIALKESEKEYTRVGSRRLVLGEWCGTEKRKKQ